MKLQALEKHHSESLMYQETFHLPDIIQQFSACRRDGRFIDLKVDVMGTVFPCHKILLDAFCPYFSAYFSFTERANTMGEEGVKKVELVSLKDERITVVGFACLLDFIYTAELQVNTDNVIDVLMCADFMQFDRVVHLCSTFLQQHITVDSCLHILVMARAHTLWPLADAALLFVLKNFTEVMTHRDFIQLSKEDLMRILKDPRLDVSSEATVLEAILQWVKEDPERLSCLRHLLSCITMTPAEITILQQNGMKNPELAQKLTALEAFIKGEMTKSSKPDPTVDWLNRDAILDCVMELKEPARLREQLVVVSRRTDYRTYPQDWRCVYAFDPDGQVWNLMTHLPFANRQGFTVTVVNNRMHVTGGQDIVIPCLATCRGVFTDHEVFDPLLREWSELQPLKIPRFNHSAACMQGKLYVVGGQETANESSLRADGEVYDPGTDQWTFISPLRCILGIGNAALISLNDRLYLIGGTVYTGLSQTVPYDSHMSAQLYDPKADLWQELLPLEREIIRLNLKLDGAGAVTASGLMLLLEDGVGKWHHVYNPLSGAITPLMQAHGHHWSGAWGLIGGSLVVTGGVENAQSGASDMVHAWDLSGQGELEEGIWNMMPPLPKPLSHHACLTLYLPRR